VVADYDLPEVTEAMQTLRESKYGKAVASLKRALEICAYMPPDQRTLLSVQLHQLLSYCLFHQGKYREAAAHLEEQVGVGGPVPIVQYVICLNFNFYQLFNLIH
jgi:tetratricopeptide (TPR) repeat protein